MKCTLAPLFELLGKKWNLQIIHALDGSTQRFSELEKTLKITPKMLTKRLSELEEAGYVRNEQKNTCPPTSNYSLTQKGEQLAHKLLELDCHL